MITVPADTKLLIFDLDSTIVMLRVDWVSVKAKLAQTFPGVSFNSLSGGIRDLRAKHSAGDIARAFEILRSFEIMRLPHMEPVTETIECIHAHEGSVKMAVCSNNLHQTIEDVLQMLSIRTAFSAIVGRDDVLESKPDPEGLRAILAQCETAAEHAYFIGDHDIDAQAGAAAGITTLLLTHHAN